MAALTTPGKVISPNLARTKAAAGALQQGSRVSTTGKMPFTTASYRAVDGSSIKRGILSAITGRFQKATGATTSTTPTTQFYWR